MENLLGMGAFIREATPGDASGMVQAVKATLEEPNNNLMTTPGEFELTEDDEREFIKKVNEDTHSLILVAEVITDSKIVGVLTLRAHQRASQRHVVRLGVSVVQDWRGQELGTKMLSEAISWARRHDTIRRIELDVIERNHRAMNLYLRLGFKIEGRAVGAVFKDNQYLDMYWMALDVSTKA